MDIFGTVLGYIGAICIGIFSSPQLIRVIKTKDTYSIPLLMFAILFIGSLCFTIQGIVNICLSPNMWDTYVGATIANFFSTVLSGGVLSIKLVHMYFAYKQNITEKQYCEQLLAQKKKGSK